MARNDTIVQIIPYRPEDKEAADAARAAIAEPLARLTVIHASLGDRVVHGEPIHLFFGEREVQMMADIIERQKASNGAES